MKQNELKAILEDESLSINDKMAKIQALNGQDIGHEQSKYQASIESLQTENNTLKSQIQESNTKLAGFQDYEELKKFKADSIAKVENERKAQFLKSLGCKHPDLLEGKVDWSKLTYNESSNTYEGNGLEDIKVLQNNYPSLFGIEENNGYGNPYNPVFTPSSGPSTGSSSTLEDLFYDKFPECKPN